MTPEEGYRLAQYQCPGVVIVMGPECAVERRINPLGYHDRRKIMEMDGPCSGLEYDLGFNLSLWALSFGMELAATTGRMPSKEKWAWLNSGACSLADARAWLKQENRGQ